MRFRHPPLRQILAKVLRGFVYLGCFHVHVVRAQMNESCLPFDANSCFFRSGHSERSWGRVFLLENSQLIEKENQLMILKGLVWVDRLQRSMEVKAPFVLLNLPPNGRVFLDRRQDGLKVVNLGDEFDAHPLGGEKVLVLPHSEVTFGSVDDSGRARVTWPRSLPLKEWSHHLHSFFRESSEKELRQTLDQELDRWRETTRSLASLSQWSALEDLQAEKERRERERLRRENRRREQEKWRRLYQEKLFLGGF